VSEIKGAIGVAATRLITDALAKARKEDARAMVIQLDTPGGLVTSTRDIIQQILASPVPVINETMVRAIAKQAEAERLRRAKVIDAEGEQQAAEKLAQAGEILSGRPEALQLRYLGALQNIAGERSSTIVFPIPINLFEKLSGSKVG
jgi:hypothetical protein